MIMKQISVVGAVLVLGCCLAASGDALAGGQGGLCQRSSQTVKSGALNPARPQNKPPAGSISGSTISHGNSASGPYKPVLGYGW